MNTFSSKKLLHSKWTKIESINNNSLDGQDTINVEDNIIILKGWAIDSEKNELDSEVGSSLRNYLTNSVMRYVAS